MLLGTQLQLASMLDAADQRALASERYRIVLKTNPNNVAALNNLAYNLAVHQNALAEALPLARRAVAIAPSEGAVLDTLGWVEHLAGNDKEAARWLATGKLKPTPHSPKGGNPADRNTGLSKKTKIPGLNYARLHSCVPIRAGGAARQSASPQRRVSAPILAGLPLKSRPPCG